LAIAVAVEGEIVSSVSVAIIGAGPYGLSLAAHLAARKVKHRIFGRPMQFWSNVAEAGGARFLRTYCFGTNISTPNKGFSFADYSRPRSLETFEPCSIRDFAAYGHWFQQSNAPWVEPVDVSHVTGHGRGFALVLADGQRCIADHVIIAVGLTSFDFVPPALRSLAEPLAIHASRVADFAAFQGKDVAVVGAGQSALEAAALLQEVGARPHLLVRKNSIHWMNRVPHSRSLWQKLRSPISSLGSGPKAWALDHFPGALHRLPAALRSRFVKNYLSPGGAWWLRERIEHLVPICAGAVIVSAGNVGRRVELHLSLDDGRKRTLTVDHVIAGTGYNIDVDRLTFLDPQIRQAVRRTDGAPILNASFETSVAGLRIVGPASAPSFGPLFRFVAGSEYTARVISAHIAAAQRSR
jgi:FAD-dependent urate hydroxylase